MEQDMEIDGKTKLYAIVADPIEQVKTPQTLNALMRERNFNGVLVPMQVAPEHLTGWFESLRTIKNFGGLVITVPHKQAIAKLCDEVSDAARLIGAVNVVRREADGRMVGDILDGKGFVAGLRGNGIEPKGKRVFMAGAGGAANAIAFALAQAGVASLGIHNRSQDKVLDMISRLHQVHPDIDAQAVGASPVGYDIVINATSLGMKSGDLLPLDVSSLSTQQVVAEIIMKPEMTALLTQAQAQGCKIHLGLPMLRSQVALMAAFMGIDG
jgi:shikimate dehydrogenase